MLGTFAMVRAMGDTIGSPMASGSAAEAKSKAASVQRQVRVLEANLAKTLMITDALWEILRDKCGLTIEDLHEKLYEVDMRDGVLDGKNQRKITKCPKCGRTVSPRHPACIYCGQVIDNSVFVIN